MIVHTQKSGASFARHAARHALQPNNNIQNIQSKTTKKDNGAPVKSTTAAEIDKIVVSVENATKRLSQVSTNTNSSKRKSKNHVGPWRLGRTLGRGSTGRVRLAKHSETGQLAAVKIVPKAKFQKESNGDNKESSPYGIEREIIIMKLISHQNIMGLYDVWENKGELYLVLEYVEGGELFDYLIKKGKLPEKEAIHYFRQIISGVSYCHQFNICHRDLKPENLLLDRNMNIKIADFGMAALEVNQKLLETSCGSPHYASPEIVTGKNYHGSPSDVWSCGIILFALLTGHLPFDDENIRKLLMKVQSGRFIMPNYLSGEAKDLIWKMLDVNPAKRIKINDILKHPLLTKYETVATAKSNKSDKEKLDDYYSEVDQLQIKKEDIDRDIVKSLSILFHGATEATLTPKLLSSYSNPEKIFYFLLYKYKKQHQIKEKQETMHNKAPKKTDGDGTLKKSKSMIKTTITNEDGSTTVKTEPMEMPPLPATPKKKVVKSSAGQIRIPASSSYRRGVSFNNKTINTDNMSRSSSKKSISSMNNTNINMKKRQSLLPPLPDLEIDWLNIDSENAPSAEFASLYNEIFNMKSPARTPKSSPKKPHARPLPPVSAVPPQPPHPPLPSHILSQQENHHTTSSPLPLPQDRTKFNTSNVPLKSGVEDNASTSPAPVSAAAPAPDAVSQEKTPLPRQVGNFEVNRRNASTPLPRTKQHTLDPNYKARSISNDGAQVLQKFGVSLKRDKKTNSKIYYSKSSTSINLSALLKNDAKSELRNASDVPPLPERRITSSKYGSFDELDEPQPQHESPASSYNDSHESSFDFEVPTKTEMATIVPIANGSNLTVHKNPRRDDSMFADADVYQENFFGPSHSDESIIKHHKKASSNVTTVLTPSMDVRGSLFNNPSDLRDGTPVPRISSLSRPRYSEMDERNETKSTIMDTSMFADNTDDDMEYGGAKRVTTIFDDFQHWNGNTSSMMEHVETVEPTTPQEPHKPIKQSALKQIQENDLRASPSGTMFKKVDLQPQRFAPSAPEKRIVSDASSIPVKKSNWFTKFFSNLLSSESETSKETKPAKVNRKTTREFDCSIPLPQLKRAVKTVLELKRKEGTLTTISESGETIKAVVPRAYTLGSPLKFQIYFDYETRKITLQKLKGSKKLFKNLSNALEFVIENETQRFNEAKLI